MSRLCIKKKSDILNFSITENDTKNSIKTFASSKKYIKHLVKGSLINILYQRVNIDKKYFIEKNYYGIPYVSHKDTGNDFHRLINHFFIYMKAFNDAIDKGYIKYMYLFFLDSETKEILEDYKFAFNYSDGVQETTVKSEEVKAATKDFFIALKSLGEYDKFPDNTVLEIEFVFDNDTPDNYQPPHFERADNPIHLQKENMTFNKSVTLGAINTNFHAMTCRVRGKVFCISRAATPAPSIVKDALNEEDTNDFIFDHNRNTEQIDDDETQIPQIVDTENFNTNAAVVDFKTKTKKNISKTIREIEIIESEQSYANKSKDVNFNSTVISLSDEEDNVNNTLASEQSIVVNFPKLDCICKYKIMHVQIPVASCVKCHVQYHLPCLSYLEASHVDGEFICNKCGNTQDKYLKMINPKEHHKVARLRFFVTLILQTNKVPISLMKQLCGTNKNEMLKKLKSMGAVKQDNKKYVVSEGAEKLRRGLFHEPKNSQFLPNTEEFLNKSRTSKNDTSDLDSINVSTKRQRKTL